MARSKKESTSALGAGLCRYLVGYLCNRSNATGRSDLYRTSRVYPQRSRPPLRNAIHFSFSCSPSAPVPFSVVQRRKFGTCVEAYNVAAHTSRSPKRKAALSRGADISGGSRRVRTISAERRGEGGRKIDARSISTITMWEDGKSKYKM